MLFFLTEGEGGNKTKQNKLRNAPDTLKKLQTMKSPGLYEILNKRHFNIFLFL